MAFRSQQSSACQVSFDLRRSLVKLEALNYLKKPFRLDLVENIAPIEKQKTINENGRPHKGKNHVEVAMVEVALERLPCRQFVLSMNIFD